MGKLGDKYCEKRGIYYFCDYRKLSNEQLAELGLSKWGGMRPPYISDVPNKKGCHDVLFAGNKNCKKGEVAAFHGTSYENARKIIGSGFEPHTGIFGYGGYFSESKNWDLSGNIEYSLPTNYARQHKRGTVVMGCIPKESITTSHYIWNTFDKETRREFSSLKGDVPDSVESFFSKRGGRFDTKEDLHKGYEIVGKKVQEFAVQHGIDAYEDNTQIIVYNEDLLNQIKFKEVKRCRTM